MAKFPSQRKLTYTTGDMGINSFTALSSGGVSGHLNLPKDLSLLNRRGYASTTRKGVPLIYRCKVDFFLQNEDGKTFTDGGTSDPSVSNQQGAVGLLKINGAQNNWVMRNAAVKWHAALAAMRRQAGIKKRDLGAYAHEIRFEYDTNGDTWLVPIDGDGDAFTGGTWDSTRFTTYADQDFGLKIVGGATEEETQAGLPGVQNMAYSYLMSRAQPLADSNEHVSETPSDYSILRTMLEGSAFEDTSTRVHDAREDAENQGDNPPYELIDISDSGDVNHDITEPVELGRITVGGLSQIHGSMIVDIPFGIADPKTSVYSSTDLSGVEPFEGLMQVEVLDIFEMQG